MSAIGFAQAGAEVVASSTAVPLSLKALGKRRETDRKPRSLNRVKVVAKDKDERVTRSRSTLDDGANETRSGEEGNSSLSTRWEGALLTRCDVLQLSCRSRR